MMRKLLIANRGEIAVRIMRTAREMGIHTLAVYSDADRDSVHAALADEAVDIGDPAPANSYLNIPLLIEVARTRGADALHPGYGFLSERPELVEACEAAGLTFVGPPAAAMRRLGSKIEAKKLAVASEVPVTPGFFEPGATPDRLRQAAEEIGYPVMLKASAGGGGRGMRIVREPEGFARELELASDEAWKAFGDGEMMVEKLVVDPRHIEAQFVADRHGQVAVLFERECSIQRRHQKLIEEAPSVVLERAPEEWPALRDAVTRLAHAAGYVGAGTAEFIYEESTGQFYFLEVNARLQVEHPVTEAITGLDLVRLQLEVADGRRLEVPASLLGGERAAMSGHAIEARVVAEDPERDFLPSVGRILAWAEPRGPGVRIDSGYGPGATVSRYYDSLLAKVIAHGPDRTSALSRLEAALQDFHILGVKTNIPFLLEVIRHPEFQAGRFDTGFLSRELPEWTMPVAPVAELAALMSAASVATQGTSGRSRAPRVWDLADGFRIGASGG